MFKRRMPLTAEYAFANGWTLETSGRHLRLVKGKFKYTVSKTASDWRADMKIVADLRRYDTKGYINGEEDTKP